MSIASPAAQAAPIKLADTGVYQEFLTIRAVEAPADTHHLQFTSQFANAKNPDALQVRYSLTLHRNALQNVRDQIDAYLANTFAT